MRGFFLFLILLGYFNVGYAQTQIETQTSLLQPCKDQQFKISFYCDPNWEIVSQKDVMVIYLSKENPELTLTIARSEAYVIFLDQLNKSVIQEIGHLKDGFDTTKAKLGEQEAILATGKSNQEVNTYLEEYFVIYDFNLYGFYFSYNPHDPRRDYPLVKKVTESIRFF